MNIEIIKNCEKKLKSKFEYLEDVSLFNQEKVLNAFKKNKISLRHFNGTTGYGYGDEGRDTLNSLVADIFNAETAICSPNIVSGTHALSLSLFGVLRPNDVVLSISGKPYDTLNDVINGENIGSLKDFGVIWNNLTLINGEFNNEKISEFLTNNKTKMVYIQRSRGYEWRDAISVDKIGEIIKFIRNLGFDGCIMVDNCYGEFVEKLEPTDVGASIIAGSMIKNPGGGIAPTGGYIAGDKKYVDQIAGRLTAPSIGGEVGSYAYGYRLFYQGLFIAPHVVKEALKGSLLFGEVLKELGYETSPETNKIPYDITRSIKFNDREKVYQKV
jgi:cystathionine beta-lyase family protein involved in aluminum resistance